MNFRQTFIVDASYNYKTKVLGIGIVIHETDNPTKGRNGPIIDQLSESYLDIPSGHGEMLALYRSLQISKDRGYQNIRLRSDYNRMRKALKQSYNKQKDFDRIGLYGEVMRISKIFQSVEFGYKPRRKNQMAHKLSRIGSIELEPITEPNLIKICNMSSPKLK